MTSPTQPGSDAGGLLLVLSGPSGVGKTTIGHAVLEHFDGVFSVSATTRQRTRDEVDGVDYFFISEDEFKDWIEQGRFLEHAQVYDGTWYGTPSAPVDEQLERGRLVLLDIDVQGACQVRNSRPDCLSIFLLPPSEEELHRRLQSRARESQEQIERRFAKAQKEIKASEQPGIYDHFVVNDDLSAAIDQVEKIIRSRLHPS
ncbi:MAG: guanylate kinase [Phycisphaerae bacterium]|nr:guanylate kinase [Phycisphaerae bacterium]